MSAFAFVWMAVSFTAGILLHAYYEAKVLWALLIVTGGALWVFRRSCKFQWVFMAGLILLGMVYGHLDRYPAPSLLIRSVERAGIESFYAVEGEVVSEPEIKIYGKKQTVSFVFEVFRLTQWKKASPGLRWKASGKIQVFMNQPGIIPEVTDRLRLWGKLSPLPEPLNPGGFDYRKYLRARDIDLILNTYGQKSVRGLRTYPLKPKKILSSVRQKIRSRIQSLFEGEKALLVQALILGDRKNLQGPLLDHFLKTGTTHLLAISGLNISMAAGSFYLLLLLLRLPQKKAAGLALIMTVFQALIGGFGIPLQRASVMAGLGFTALMLERERSGMNVFAFAFFALLLADTRSLESIAFQLSFLSLFCLILFTRFWNRAWPWAEAVGSGSAVLAGTFPAVLYHFSTFSPIGILTNVLAIPLFHLALFTALLSLLADLIPAVPLGDFLAAGCGIFLEAGLRWIQWCASADWGYFFLPRPSWLMMGLYYAALGGSVFCFLQTPSKKIKILRGFFLAFWFGSAGLFFRNKPVQGFEAVFFSAGSNEIAHLAFGPDNHWLINSGRTFPGDQARWIVEPYLKSRGIKRLKGILFTDTRKRHTAGFETLRRNFQFQYEVHPAPRKKDLPEVSGKKVFLDRGSRILMPEGSKLEVLGNSSRERLTVRVLADGKAILFVPDLSLETFKQLLSNPRVKTELMALPSLRAESDEMLKSFLSFVRPRAIAAPEISEPWRKLLDEKGISFFELKTQGALRVTLKNETGLKLEPFLKNLKT